MDNLLQLEKTTSPINLKQCFNLIEARHGKRYTLNQLNLFDPVLFELFRSGETDLIPGFSTDEAKTILSKLPGPNEKNPLNSIFDLACVLGVTSPGALRICLEKEWLDFRNRSMTLSRVSENILRETNGSLIFKEQAIDLLIDIGDFEKEQAETVFFALGKKTFSHEQQLHTQFQFVSTGDEKDVPLHELDELWMRISGRAHVLMEKTIALRSAHIAFFCMWMKCYFPKEWKDLS